MRKESGDVKHSTKTHRHKEEPLMFFHARVGLVLIPGEFGS